MLTTLTLDDDVAAKLKAEARRTGRPLREIVNATLRRGLAMLAAIALEHGATPCTTDRGFTRFSGLKWTNPLAANGGSPDPAGGGVPWAGPAVSTGAHDLFRRRSSLAGLTYRHPDHMDFHMKTTLNIDDTVMAELKREAARQGRTMSELVETALRNLFRSQKQATELAPLPVFRSGGAFVDIADRDALYQAMEGR
jgi:hypothetical protein